MKLNTGMFLPQTEKGLFSRIKRKKISDLDVIFKLNGSKEAEFIGNNWEPFINKDRREKKMMAKILGVSNKKLNKMLKKGKVKI